MDANGIKARWKNLSSDDPRLAGVLMKIHMGAFDDLRRNGHRITVSGKPASEVTPGMSPEERLTLACGVGNGLIQRQQAPAARGVMGLQFSISMADCFPHCIAIAFCAVMDQISPGPLPIRFSVVCSYKTARGGGDPLGALLQEAAPLFPWAKVQIHPEEEAPPEPEKLPVIDLNRMNTLIMVKKAIRVDVARTAFIGRVFRGSLKKGDVLNVTDEQGQALCRPGPVMLIVSGGRPVEEVRGGAAIDEMLVAVDLPGDSGPVRFLTAE